MYTVVTFPKNYCINESKMCFPIYLPNTLYKNKADAELDATKLAKENPNNEYVVFAAAKGFMQEDTPIVTKTYVMGY